MVRAALRGGVAAIGHKRHAVANNPVAAVAEILRKEGLQAAIPVVRNRVKSPERPLSLTKQDLLDHNWNSDLREYVEKTKEPDKGVDEGVEKLRQKLWRFIAKEEKAKPENYDPSKPRKWILYLDAHNLHGSSMQQPLPDGGFELWEVGESLEEQQKAIRAILECNKDAARGLVAKVGIQEPNKHFQDLQSALPALLEKRKALASMYSVSMRRRHEERCAKTVKDGKTMKLVPTLYDEEFYVDHAGSLKFAVEELGRAITRVHSILFSRQSKWLAEWVDFCTAKRRVATSDFEKDMWNLLANLVFGTNMKNVFRRVNCKFCMSYEDAVKMHSDGAYMGCVFIKRDLSLFMLRKKRLSFVNPFRTASL